MYINLHDFLERSTENGPGTRAVIWVQGCTLQCPGCFNPETHNMGIRQLVSVRDLAERVLAISGIEGITISGGEPFLQAEALAELGVVLHQNNFGVIVFSGFIYEYLLQANKPDWNALLAVTDLLIAGPFIQDLTCNLALRGSSNQILHFLSERYTAFRDELEGESHSVEVLIDESGQVIVTGFPGNDIFPC
jgi:anaerobic ribonucleoside-triphosphate reductase activating protein